VRLGAGSLVERRESIEQPLLEQALLTGCLVLRIAAEFGVAASSLPRHRDPTYLSGKLATALATREEIDGDKARLVGGPPLSDPAPLREGREKCLDLRLVRAWYARLLFATRPMERYVPICRTFLVGRGGFEPPTLGLKVPCSTAELPALDRV
jgi:hypothetical protein